MGSSAPLDLSVVVSYGDHEDVIGAACRRLASHLRELRLQFEIVAVEEASSDNSGSVLTLLRDEIPELRFATSAGVGRGFAVGAGQARGRTVLLIRPQSALATLAPVGRAHRRVANRELDLVIVEGRFAVLHRTRCLAAVTGQKLVGFRRLARRARARDLAVETYQLGGSLAERRRALGLFVRAPWRSGAEGSGLWALFKQSALAVGG